MATKAAVVIDPTEQMKVVFSIIFVCAFIKWRHTMNMKNTINMKSKRGKMRFVSWLTQIHPVGYEDIRTPAKRETFKFLNLTVESFVDRVE